MSHALNENIHSTFVPLAEVRTYIKKVIGFDIKQRFIIALTDLKLLPVYDLDSILFVLKNDLLELAPALENISAEKGLPNSLFDDLELLTTQLANKTEIHFLKPDNQTADPTYYSAVRNLVSKAMVVDKSKETKQMNMLYYSSMKVSTTSRKVSNFIKKQQLRTEMSDMSKLSQFTNSASYMGSKRSLSGFIVEALSRVLPSNGIAVDLMCGSGVVSGAFSRNWRTIASDAQDFCQSLATVQGGGGSLELAESLLDKLIPRARSHADKLCNNLRKYVDLEDHFFHADINDDLLADYKSFIDTFPRYPDGKGTKSWNPVREIEKRKKNVRLQPYCLFTAYFANIYFGLRQCIEIDSLRYAIEKLKDEQERQWAIGALVASISKSGTTYAGHFAQPRIKNSNDLTSRNLATILEKRTQSIIYEFSARIMNLGQESEKAKYPVEVVSGPWQDSLVALEGIIKNKQAAIYIDPPYKREEYSRYYHVLETVVKYSYPSCEGIGKMPSKKNGERFKSEFFTRKYEQATQNIVHLISNVLDRGWISVWSYADSGDANIVDVINKISNYYDCYIRSYAVPYRHQSQGGKSPKIVTEYLVFFIPSDYKLA